MIDLQNNYFTLFQSKIDFDIDQKYLKKKYLLLISNYHPDKAKNNLEIGNLMQISSHLNKAYCVLTNDLLRAEYILSLYDNSLYKESIKGDHQIENNDIDLSRIWEEMEIIENANITTLLLMMEQKQSEKSILLNQLSSAFSMQDFVSVLEHITLLRYLEKSVDLIIKQIDECKYKRRG